jgi:ATP/maltotriose-dependent transcriptional regulator MalT
VGRANGQAFAWVSVDDRDNDPVQPVGARVFEALASPVSSVPGSVVPRLGTALASMTTPVALVLDDVHLLHDRECQSALSVLADHVPGRSRLVLAGRAEPPVRIARLRAEGRAVGLYLAALALKAEGSLGSAAVPFAGDDRLVSEYVESAISLYRKLGVATPSQAVARSRELALLEGLASPPERIRPACICTLM